jgi:nitrous oxidase accessory protein NosD
MKPRKRTSRWLILLYVVASGTAFPAGASGPNPRGLYVPPAVGFIHDPLEIPVALELGQVPLTQVQRQLDEARAANPDVPIVLTLTGVYVVTSTPLTLPSKTSLVLYGTILSLPFSSAPSLVAITGQSQVAVSGGYLEGFGADLVGIDVAGSTKVNIDAVTITNTGRDGIVLGGQGNSVWNSGSAITRCEVTRAGGNGITIDAVTQALVLDNLIRDTRGAGIQVGAVHSAVVNNVSQNNGVGIVVEGSDDLIADNELRGNRSEGLRLTSTAANTTVLRNAVHGNATAGIDLDGTNNLVYANALHNTLDLVDRAAANWVVARGTPLAAPVSRYFYPPTIDNRHADRIMNGRERTELVIDAGTTPTISGVQQAYDAARALHPDDVIVLTLSGAFTLDGPSLLLQSRTAVLLDGSISVPVDSTAAQAITATNPAEFVSISGGTIDLAGVSREGVFFPSATMTYLEQVTVRGGGQRDVRAGKGMIHFQRGGGYTILHRNTVDTSGGRCIWTQNSNSRYVVLENYVTNCNQDGVDFDSSTTNSVAIGNTSVDNVRYGIFIEQSDSLNKLYGNTATTRGIPGIPGRAIGIYNNATSSATRGITDKNTIFCNASDVIADGLRLGSIATAAGGVAETAHTFLFNNVVRNSRGSGILVDTQFERSVQNYFSQTVLTGNGRDLTSRPSNGGSPADFFNPPPALNLALRRPAVASSSAPGASPDAAVDGLAYTRWIAGAAKSSLTVDFGGPVRFGRILLKRTPTPALVVVELQISDDGVNFSALRGIDPNLALIRISNVRFAPVEARFLRLQFKTFLGGPVGVEEISVHPE